MLWKDFKNTGKEALFCFVSDFTTQKTAIDKFLLYFLLFSTAVNMAFKGKALWSWRTKFYWKPNSITCYQL